MRQVALFYRVHRPHSKLLPKRFPNCHGIGPEYIESFQEAIKSSNNAIAKRPLQRRGILDLRERVLGFESLEMDDRPRGDLVSESRVQGFEPVELD